MDQALRDAVSTEGVSKIDKHVRLPGGGTRTLAVYCQHQPERRRIVGLVVDVSERYAVEEALREEDRRKAEFIAILSHELRNPLAPIVYALPAIQRAPLGEDARRAADVIKRQMTHLARLVDDLLDISRINSGKVELRRETLELRPIVEAVVESMAPLFEAARHDVEVTLPEQPIWLEADPHRLAQILTNLLSNATRYTPRGGKIWLRATRERRRAVISVKDSGIGIAPDLMPRLFEMFQQIHRAEGLPQGGLGIGLALARRLATMHGGGIEAHSEGPGKGAEFIVTMPLARHRAAGEQHAAEAAVPAAARLKVLIVDDNADLVEMLATLIGSLGHNARKALDGPSALAAARAYGPDVVLLDLGLPMMSGLEVARALRTGAETRNAYLVALTGWGQDEDVRRTREAGFDRHLTKPTDPETLVALLSELAARRAAP